MVTGVGVVLMNVPLWISSYWFDLGVPNVSLTAENVADFISAFLIGNLLQMAFRFWAFRRWVFPEENVRGMPVGLLDVETLEEIAEEELGHS